MEKVHPKETYHVELDISGSELEYQAGDSCGVLANNPKRLVDEILESTRFSGNENVYIGSDGYTLRNALTNHLETSILTVDNIKKHNDFAQSSQLDKLLTDPKQLSEFIYGRDYVDLLKGISL
jgi:sulfite reductase (NADPH) flavoprotein alpha-component